MIPDARLNSEAQEKITNFKLWKLGQNSSVKNKTKQNKTKHGGCVEDSADFGI